MSTPKGYPCQKKEDRLAAEFTTVQPVSPNRFGLDTVANCFAFQVGTDTVDSSTTQIITSAGHSAIKGDVIRFTSGALDKRIFSVWDVDTNTITLSQTMDAAPSAGDAFTVFRYHPSVLSLTGSPTAAIVFTRDGSAQEVIEDTVTPANNRPLPVKLQDFSGDMILNAANLNLEVQLDHDSTSPDSVQVGDGVETLSITAAGKAEVDPGYSTDSGASNATTPRVVLATRHEAAATPIATEISNGTNFAAFGAGVVGADVIRTTPASDSPHLLSTRHETASTPIAANLSNGTNFAAFGAGANAANVLRTTPANDAKHLLSDRHEAIATPLSVQLSDTTGVVAWTNVTASQQSFGAIGNSVPSVAVSAGWDGGSNHVELMLDGNGRTLLSTRHEAVATPVSVRSGNGTSFDAYDSGSSDTTTPRVVLATRHESASTPVATRFGNGTNFADFDSGTAGSNTLRVVPATNYTYPKGRTKADGPWRNDYTSTSVTTAAYTQIDASAANDINRLQIFDSSGQTMLLATGGAGAETDVLYIPPGGIDVDYYIPAGTRISIKAVSATASVGEIVINALT